jgi:hypothetical protein
MNKIYAIVAIALVGLSSCSKTEPEKEPSEQVIGTYNVDQFTQSLKYDLSSTTSSETLNLPEKDSDGELSATFDVAKKSSNTVLLTYTWLYKPTTGTAEKDVQAFGDYELRKVDNAPAGQFELYDVTNATKAGTIGNNIILIEEMVTGQDSLKRKYTYTQRITGKKTN